MNKSVLLLGSSFKPGHVHQHLGQSEPPTPIHPLAAFLVDAGTVVIGASLFQEKKVPAFLKWAGLAMAGVGAIRGLARLSEIG